MKILFTRICVGFICCLGLCSIVAAQISVWTQHNDNNRTGQNNSETLLNTSNVNVSNFGKLFALPVDGYIYAQPLYMPNVTINGVMHNVLYIATEHNSVYAFDADDPTGVTLWHTPLGPSVPSDDVCGSSGCYTDLVPEIGITGTPVIDTQAGVLYVAAKNKDSDGSYHYRLHALDVRSGAELFGGPGEISAAHFNPLFELNRPGLLLSGGKIYAAFGSEGDTPPWYGFVMAYDGGTLAQVAVLNTSPSLTSGGSIWAGGQGPVADSAGNVYVITANGNFNASTGGGDYGTSFLKLDGSTLSVLDSFTPDNQSFLGNFVNDVDLGAGGPLLIPGTSLVLGGGKDGMLRLVDSTNMGKFNANFNADVQEWPAISGNIMGGAVYYASPKLGPVVYLWGDNQPMQAWSFNGTTFQTSAVSKSTVANAAGYSNMAPLSISSNNGAAGSGIVWAATSLSGNANEATVPGQLWAFRADDLTQELWDSQQNSSRDEVGNYAKFNPPTVANGKVYLPTFSDQVLVYGLLAPPPDFSISISPSTQSVTAGSSASYIIYANPQGDFSGSVALACMGLPSGVSCSPASVLVEAGGPQVSTPVTVNTGASSAAGTTNFTIAASSGPLSHSTNASLTVTVGASSFSLSAAPLNPSTLTAGGSATSSITVTPSGGFSGTVTLSCAITPAASVPPQCNLSPATLAAGSGTPTLTITTVAQTASVHSKRRALYYAILLPVFGLAWFGTILKLRARQILSVLLGCFVALALGWMVACGGGSSANTGGNGGGGGNSGTTAGNYNVAITATSGTISQTKTLSFTVQ